MSKKEAVEMAYEVQGVGPPLLMLHAGVADSRMWDVQFEQFAKDFCLIRCDLRGYGHSPLPNGPFAYHEDINTLVGLLDSEPIWLMGASFGAQVAVDFALAYPEKVQGLVLISPVVSGFQPEDEVLKFGEQEDELLEAGRLAEATELNLQMWVDGPYRSDDTVDPELRRWIGEMQLQAFSQPMPENVSLRKLDPLAIERLHALSQPVQIISGALDVPEFVSLASMIEEKIPNATRIVVPDVAHMVSMEVPERFNQDVMNFILPKIPNE